jgi:hypothetical protein
MQQWHVRYLHGFSIDAGREAHDCDQGVNHAEGEETVLQDPAHYSHQLERDVLFYIDHILYSVHAFNLLTSKKKLTSHRLGGLPVPFERKFSSCSSK